MAKELPLFPAPGFIGLRGPLLMELASLLLKSLILPPLDACHTFIKSWKSLTFHACVEQAYLGNFALISSQSL